MNSKRKGKVGELELCEVLRNYGFEARRGRQYKGTSDSPDVIGIPGFHIECKRCEQGNIYAWLDQATEEAGKDSIPVVMHRRNGREWVVIIGLDEFCATIKKEGLHAREKIA